MTKRIVYWSSLCLLLLTLVSCADYLRTADRFDAGETLTPDRLTEISEEIFSTGSPESSGGANDQTVYWLKNSKVYHTDPTCYHLRDKENVTVGTVERALAEGKTKSCAACSPAPDTESQDDSRDTNGDSESQSEPTVVDPAATVYWLKTGTVYHTTPDCRHIAGKDNLASGTVLDAHEAGITNLCKACRNTETETATDTETESKTESESVSDTTPADGIVYWLKTGTVYHTDPDCHHIAGKDQVCSGSVEEAAEAGKKKLCSSCGAS